ncbi:ABC transporter permease [Dyella sp. 20L07]|uniref:ABC transporter permease n=1 Tax=Dyella sp. 20L07 TaxID=3384240 RepID=UPI003D2BD9C4
MAFHPILSSLGRHKLTAGLLTLQVALTFAIVCNVVFMVVRDVDKISLASGVDENRLSMLDSEIIDKSDKPLVRHITDLAALRSIPGVEAAVAVDTLPLGRNESSYGTCGSAEDYAKASATSSMMRAGSCVQPAVLGGTPGELGALGLHLIAGRDFHADEYGAGSTVPSVILSRSLAERFFPGETPIGRSIYTGEGKPVRVVGVVDTLLRPNLRGAEVNQYAMLFPMLPNESSVTYLLRSAPGDRERVLRAAVAKLEEIQPQRIIAAKRVRTYQQMRDEYFQRDNTMLGLLVASALGLLFVTALGITGLANFWVQQRRRTIGIRRAIGATRHDILRYFQAENFLIVSGGIVLGAVLAVVLNLTLMQLYELPRLPSFYLPIAAIVLWLLGQLAVLGPALRAAAVPPVVATRSV